MLYPSINQLIAGDKQCRYSLVIAVAKEARLLSAEAENNGIKMEENPIKAAVAAFSSGKAHYQEPTDVHTDEQ